jgi:S-(hydroxymethyl)glutathione dehydrogenase / alcohol dehydrogenase
VKAAILRGNGKPLTTEEVSTGALFDRGVRVRIVASGVCGSDLHTFEGDVPFLLPTVLGHEGAGVVEEIGRGETEVAVGDHVVGCMSRFCGSCRVCLSGQPHLCTRHHPDQIHGFAFMPAVIPAANGAIGEFAETIATQLATD